MFKLVFIACLIAESQFVKNRRYQRTRTPRKLNA